MSIKWFCLFMSLSFCGILHAQSGDDIKSLIEKGVELHDNGDFEGALEWYEKALAIDPNHVIALGEKAYSLHSLGRYEEVLDACKKAIKENPESPTLKVIYTTYGNTFDALEKPDEAIKAYNEGIKKFPNYYHLYYNKGITLSLQGKYAEAIPVFEKSATLNPSHASSHNALSRVLLASGKRSPALLAMSRFFVVEPEGKRAEMNLPLLNEMLMQGVKKTGENNITISIDASAIAPQKGKKKAKRKNKKGKGNDTAPQKGANDFSTLELMLPMLAALDFDEKNKDKTEREKFQEKFGTTCVFLEEQQNKNYGFYWEYYAAYFIEMEKKGFVETYSYLVYASSGDEKVIDWIKGNKDKIQKFYDWSSNYEWPR